MVEREKIIAALRDCYDPEIPINIVDLGLIYGVEIEGGKVKVKMTLTTQGCPLYDSIAEEVRSRLLKVEGIDDAEVELIWEPPWKIERMSPEGRKELNLV